MNTTLPKLHDRVVIDREHLQELFVALASKGYQIVGPTVRENAIVYDTLVSVNDLPIGYTDEQDGGTYRLKKRSDKALFGYAVGPHSWKKFLFPPVIRLWQARREGNGFEVVPENTEAPKLAFLGVRSCEIHAISIQDKVFMRDDYSDPTYRSRRNSLCIIAINCGEAGGTCFCTSMETGPRATSGFDLALTEVLSNEQHFFVVEVGSQLGSELLQTIPFRAASKEDIQIAENIVTQTAEHMGRSLDTTNIKDLLYRNLDHPRWDDVASRCLTCSNCTMVCPTCFCTTVEDVTDLTGEQAERWRKWDSCFTMDFSYIFGGSIRPSTKSRYRQWMTHKLASWIDQFGTSGCVGCGRCITWCPVGIDITEEVRAIRASESLSTQAAKEQQ
ncbi:MAG TPA: 4Fe-4S dicluster domain-containing protein [Ktedonobacteraceae bacterium]|nr:4Fe-4S dicluster domain-containing protein [Ktedonobacteraceae bacterium]